MQVKIFIHRNNCFNENVSQKSPKNLQIWLSKFVSCLPGSEKLEII